MRKHPVDDLFKRRLSDIERKPSSAAWEKIQEKNKNERRLAGWVWYAAASIAIVFVTGYVVWKSQHSNIETISKERKIAVVAKPSKPAKQNESLDNKDPEHKNDELTIPTEKLAIHETKSKSKKTEAVSQSIMKEENANEAAEIIELEKSVRINVEPQSIAALPNVEIKPEVKETVSAKVEPVPAEPTRTIVVAVQTNDQEVEEKSKSSRFSKVFRQLKNARAGERVDWEEVGFNPKSLVAKVDDRLRNGEEKVSEKYHNLKEKTKL